MNLMIPEGGVFMKRYAVVLLSLFCSVQFSCLAQRDQAVNRGPYQSFSDIPPDDDEIRQNNYPASGSGRIVPPEL